MNQNTLKQSKLWIDNTLLQQVSQNQEKPIETIELANIHKKLKKIPSKTKNYLFEMPFTERFKDKLFTFNKIGKMYKLDGSSQSPTIKASLIFSKSKIRKNPCLRSVFKAKRNVYQIKKVTESSRVSIESKDTQRQTKSLEVSKVATVFIKENKYRYGLDCSQIKEEEIEETIVKKPVNFRKLYTPHELRKGKQNTRRAIQFESEGNNSQGQKSEHQEKPFFKNLKGKQTPSEQRLAERSQNLLPDLLNRPNESHLSKRLIINTQKRQLVKAERGEQLLPKLKMPKSKKQNTEYKEKLYTIR